MFKKILLPALIISAMLTLNTGVFAEPNRSIARRLDVTAFQFTKNLDGTRTTERNQVISGRAESGTEIVMTIFWFMDEEDKSIVSKKKNTDSSDESSGQWVMQGKYNLEVGASEIFAQAVSLNLGKNRINIRIKDKAGTIKDEVINIIVYKNEPSDFLNNIILKNLKK